MNDQPGTVRTSAQNDLAILTDESGDAPWFVVTADGRRHWSSPDHIAGWPLRSEGFPLQTEDPS